MENERGNDYNNCEEREDVLTLTMLVKTEGITPEVVTLFQTIIYRYYREHGRSFPWRETTNPYHILVSEAMLQQTQTERVLHKYTEFITVFPDVLSLARAPLQKVLKVWRGLGYNRRALNLKKTAEIVVNNYNGVLPSSPEVLQTFPGIGRATAGAVAAFAYQKPSVFIETNIRTVFIYFFFDEKISVKDKEILPPVEKTLDRKNPREWYYALMDYGVMLKKKHKPLNKKSVHYQKQTPFEGSDRQIRGAIVQVLTEEPRTESELLKINASDPERVKRILCQLKKEGFIKKEGNLIRIA